MKKFTIIYIVLLFCTSTISFGQSELGDVLQKVGTEYAQKYLSPFTTGLGTNLNSGYLGGFTASGYNKLPIWPHVYAGFKFTGVAMKNNDKFFDLAFSTKETYNGNQVNVDWVVKEAPTVFGNSKPAVATGVIRGTNQTITKELIGGIEDTKFIPLIIPMIGVGTIYGTDVIFRTIPVISVGNYGKFTLVGGAIRHCIGAYAKMPFDISVQFGLQSFGIKDANSNKFIDANSMFTNIQFSKSFPIVLVYGGAQYETYNVDINYKYGTTAIAFSQKGDNHFRFIAGATVSLGPGKFNADINYGSIFAFTAGFGFGI